MCFLFFSLFFYPRIAECPSLLEFWISVANAKNWLQQHSGLTLSYFVIGILPFRSLIWGRNMEFGRWAALEGNSCCFLSLVKQVEVQPHRSPLVTLTLKKIPAPNLTLRHHQLQISQKSQQSTPFDPGLVWEAQMSKTRGCFTPCSSTNRHK